MLGYGRSFIITDILGNSINAAARAISDWVVSSVISIRRALRSASTADDSSLLIVERDFQELVPGPRAKSPSHLSVVAQRKLSEPAKTLSFHAKRHRLRRAAAVWFA
jgi:hypothetical protein